MHMIWLLTMLAYCSLPYGVVSFCDNQQNDIVMVLDSSESIDPKDYEVALNALVSTIDSLEISNNQSRVGFIQFSTEAILKFNLDTYDNKKDMIDAVRSAKHLHGQTAIGKALNLTVVKTMPKMRSSATRLVILATDGTNTMFPAPQLFADTLKANNIRVICIGIGSEIDKVELELLASENSLILVSNYGQFQQEMKRIIDHVCYLPDPQPIQPCTVPQQDLVFLVDSSSSLTPADFNNSKALVKLFVAHSKLGADKTRVAMISFSDNARLDFNIDAYSKEEDYNNAIDKAFKFGVTTSIGSALVETLKSVWPKKRPDVPFNVILTTDGENTKFPLPRIPAAELKKLGANIISVAVGEDINFDELRELSSNNKIITLTDYENLRNSVRSVERMVTCG